MIRAPTLQLLKRLKELIDAEHSEQRLAHEKLTESGGYYGCHYSPAFLTSLPYPRVNSWYILGIPTHFLVSFLLR